jgi:hypothetical protein
MDTEKIVFVNEDGTPTGEIGPKLASHTARTKLHLAFVISSEERTTSFSLLSEHWLRRFGRAYGQIAYVGTPWLAKLSRMRSDGEPHMS